MGDIQAIVELWKRARRRNESVCLATVVHVEGSSYRKPGARMLVTSSGERAGTVSGGCLEAEICKKIAWLSNSGSTVQRYSSSLDDDQEGGRYGLGCGGMIWILMETGQPAAAVMEAYERAVDERVPSVVVCALQGRVGTALINSGLGLEEVTFTADDERANSIPAIELKRALAANKCIAVEPARREGLPEYLCLPILPPPRLCIFGAGDDARPIARIASELGWHVLIADGRSHLLRHERFPEASDLAVLDYRRCDPSSTLRLNRVLDLNEEDLAVVLTHSYEQDEAILRALLPLSLRYLGILGPLHRTKHLITSIAPFLALSEDECFSRLRAPIGLDIGGEDPGMIALSIIAEIQAELMGRTVQITRDLSGTDSERSIDVEIEAMA